MVWDLVVRGSPAVVTDAADIEVERKEVGDVWHFEAEWVAFVSSNSNRTATNCSGVFFRFS